MGCRYDNETAFKRAKGLLAREAVVEYDGHRAACGKCAERFALAEATVDALKASERGATPEVDWERLYHASKAAFVEGHARALEGPRINLRVWIPAAAAVAAGLALVVWVSAGNHGEIKRTLEGPVAVVTPSTKEPIAVVTPSTKDPVAVVTPSTKDPIAVVTPSTGRVDGRRASKAEWRVVAAARGKVGGDEARAGDAVAAGEKIVTGPGGSVTVAVGATSRIEVASASVVVPLRVTEAETELELERGKLTAHIAPKGADGKFAVRAGGWRVEVTGTVFSVERRGGDVRVETTEGAVRVTGPGFEDPRIVTAGENFDSVTLIKKPIDVRRARKGLRESVPGPSRAETRAPAREERRREVVRPRVERPRSSEMRREVDEFRRAGDELLREYER